MKSKIIVTIPISNNKNKALIDQKDFNKVNKYKWFVSGMNNRWEASISINKKRIYLGCFFTKEQAAKTYQEAAKKYHKEFANF